MRREIFETRENSEKSSEKELIIYQKEPKTAAEDSAERERHRLEFAESLIRDITDSEKAISALKIDERGHMAGLPALETDDPMAENIKQKRGVIDARLVMGCLIAVYNSNEEIPDGFPDLNSQNRSAEYDPENNIIYVDLSDSWSFLNDKYQPETLSPFVSHELRHHFVKLQDKKVEAAIGVPEVSRYEPDGSEKFYQLAYLDELHSQFFDYISGRDQSGFESPDAEFYSTAGRGKHWEIASKDPATGERAKELVYYLQAFILLKEAAKQEELKEDIVVDYVVRRAGAALAASRSIEQAISLLKNQWSDVMREENIKSKVKSHLLTYQQSYERHTPELSDELKSIIGE